MGAQDLEETPDKRRKDMIDVPPSQDQKIFNYGTILYPEYIICQKTVYCELIELAWDQNVDFIDAYLAVQAAKRGEKVCTFDETDFRRLPVDWVIPE